MNHLLTILATLAVFTGFISANEPPVLRVSSTLQGYNIGQPWEKRAPYKRNGLAIVVGNNQILTTAEMVANAAFIELQTTDGQRTINAKTIAVDYEANLALLSAKSPADIEFLATFKPIELAPPAKLNDKVQMLQVEDNGMSLITTGVIRGVDVASTFVAGHFFLTYEIRATMQSAANSYTIPVLRDNKLLGILTSYSSDDQLSDVTAPEIIKAFLKDVNDGSYTGFPSLGLGITRTTDEHFRNWLQLTPAQGGIYVSAIKRNSSAQQAEIKLGDVILNIGSHGIDRRGYYHSDNYGKINWSHLIRGSHKTGDTISITLLRDGKTITKQVKLQRSVEGIIPSHTYGKAPRFLVNGGLIFQELTESYLRLFGKDWRSRAPLTLLDAFNHPADYEKDRKRLVILSRTIPTEASLGYESMRGLIIKKVNGQNIADIPSLIAAFKKPLNGIHSIELDGPVKTIYLDAATASKVNATFLQQGLPSLFRDKE